MSTSWVPEDLKDGKLKNVIIDLPHAASLASVLLEDAVVRELISKHEFHIALSPKYELTIRHIPQPEAVATESAVEANTGE